ncbi:MAG: maltose alpha-D-glucosyltransferase [Bryobacterales bacterium]|nr:maltose alpha-D-glucosyltransferase [Bryobacterales bacterium]
MKRAGSAPDPLWYKDAIIYEMHVKAFFDGNNDGVGDFGGLLRKLDYLEELGVTCLWLLPFFPSPLRDDGYDIADYLSIHPSYGNMEDFRAFLEAAHDRGLQVMVELVINHTSDQHPWFQAARKAAPGSAERDFYVWSDSDQKYKEARIIFTDTEKSNWTWDPVAKAYFWHRFFSHQPDLNFDNPAVIEEVLKAMRFWLDMGVDGLRLDAIPYLVERDGTNCENLPETHAVIRRIREEMDTYYEGRMILAEANQWPSDVLAYFGNGDKCHMAFHFPLMPRIFMALRLEDRMPVTDIMGQTPDIPETCQWGIFLRNHDELTLEMVSDEERDYMYLAYSADPRMRINIGIRRRLAPLMDNNRRRIELLNSLLFSFPGTPILYYGDEMGMGDNIYLGDRNGVRTPMQWNGDRNGGFSRANPAKLYSPPVMDPVYGYEAVNVEAQQSDPSSLLHWMRNMIALRKLFKVFGRGTMEFLHPTNRKVMAYTRRFEGEQVLCVANLSRFAQPVELDLSGFEGLKPVEMLGYVDFPVITKRPYPLTLGPYGFLWFELQRVQEAVEEPLAEEPVPAGMSMESLLGGPSRQMLETNVLPRFLAKQRWYGSKSRRMRSAAVVDWGEWDRPERALALVEAQYESGAAETYFLPLAMAVGQRAEELEEASVNGILCPVSTPGGLGVLYDATFDEGANAALLEAIEMGKEFPTRRGVIRGVAGRAYAEVRGASGPLAATRCAAEQSNTSILYGGRLMVKLFRRQEEGPNPDCEIGQYLTEKTRFERIPPFAGALEYVNGQELSTLAMAQGLVENEGDGWKWTLEQLDHYYEDCAPVAFPGDGARGKTIFELSESEAPELAREHLGIYLDSAAILGRRTGEMHAALGAASENEAMRPEPMRREHLHALAATLREHAQSALDTLKENLSKLPDEAVEQAGYVLTRRRQFLDRFHAIEELEGGGLRTRIHGDYHLGQVLRVKNDYVILDFEGEPARPLAERRSKHSPLKDVAGMLRSFSYAAYAALLNYTARRPDDYSRLEPWGRLWESATASQFLRAYLATVKESGFLPADGRALRTLLEAYLLDKALYELRYELNNRPGWIRIPLLGILSLGI